MYQLAYESLSVRWRIRDSLSFKSFSSFNEIFCRNWKIGAFAVFGSTRWAIYRRFVFPKRATNTRRWFGRTIVRHCDSTPGQITVRLLCIKLDRLLWFNYAAAWLLKIPHTSLMCGLHCFLFSYYRYFINHVKKSPIFALISKWRDLVFFFQENNKRWMDCIVVKYRSCNYSDLLVITMKERYIIHNVIALPITLLLIG